MNAITPRKNSFGRYDRILIGKAAYRYLRTDEDGAHQLQVCRDGLLEESYLRITDAKIAELQRRKDFKVEPGYFSKALDELRARHDDTDLLALSEEEARTVFWKLEWCIRFHEARTSPRSAFRPNMTPEDIATFIDTYKVEINRWYIRRFNEPRPIGRPVVVGVDENDEEILERKPFDYPSPTALRNWLRLYARTGDRMAAFAPRYHRCGNRKQLDTEYSRIVDKCVRRYAHRSKPTRKDILDQVETELNKLRKKRKEPLRLVSQSTIDRRIAKLEPFFVAAGRLGEDRAMRKFLLVGRGAQADYPMHRIEMDDWEADLQTLLVDSGAWETMNKDQRAAVARVRCTVTVAIDVRTRCIVGLNVSETAPSTPGAKAALRTITEDKTRLAKYAGAKSTWEMHGRLNDLFTDGGPVFKGEFREAAAQCGVDYTRPDPDPRQRGHIEAFFRYLRRFCRFFTGQTFSNVVEKADYPAEEYASLTVEEFRKALIEFIVDVYHNSPRRGLKGLTPRAMWEAETRDNPPAEVTKAQRLYAFGFKRSGVALDNQGLLHLDISYHSDALGEIFRKTGGPEAAKTGRGVKLDIVVDPENLGQVLVQVPRHLLDYMNSFAPTEMHGQFLEVQSVYRKYDGMTLAYHLLRNEGIRALARKAARKGQIIRIEANESLTELGRRAAARAGVASHALTAKDFDRMVANFQRRAKISTGSDPVRDDPPPHEDPPPRDDDPAPEGQRFGTVVAVGKRKGPKPKPPAPHDPLAMPAAAPESEPEPAGREEPHDGPAPEPDQPKTRPARARRQKTPAPPQPAPPAARAAPRPSRGVNEGDDD